MEEFTLFTKLPPEIQREILTINVEILKQAQMLSKETRELTKRDASKYKCKIKITTKELEKYLEGNPSTLGLYLIDINNERIIFSANRFVKQAANKYKWIKKNVKLQKIDNTLDIIMSQDTDVIIEKGVVEFGTTKSDVMTSYKKGEILHIDLRTQYEILLGRGCEAEDAKAQILKELEKEHVEVHDINYGSLNLFAYLMHNCDMNFDKDLTVEEIISKNEVIYQKLKAEIAKTWKSV